MRGVKTLMATEFHAPRVRRVMTPVRISSHSLLTVLLATAILWGCSQQSQSPQANTGSPHPGNHPPIIHSVTIVPTTAVLDQPISVQVKADDLEGDLITFRHQWRLNGAPLANETRSILGSKALKRGDVLSVEVFPYDGKIEGIPSHAEARIGNTPPEVKSVELEPADPRVGALVRANITGADADDDPVEYRYRWLRNSNEIYDGEGNTVETANFLRGDVITVEVTPSDPTSQGRVKRSKPIAIVNSPPRIISVPPTKIDKGRYAYTVLAEDPDGDALTYALEAAPPDMRIDKATGRIDWPMTSKVAGKHRIRVTATDPVKARAFQEFDMVLTGPAPSSRASSSKRLRVNARLVTPIRPLVE
jgi:putative Ig domain-containing protein